MRSKLKTGDEPKVNATSKSIGQKFRGASALCLALSLSLASSLTAVNLLMNAQPANAAHASDPENNSHKTSKHHAHPEQKSKSVDGQTASGTGLDATALDLANRGEWKEFSAHLAPAVSMGEAGSRNGAWLAFAYMYLGDCDSLRDLSHRAATWFDARAAANLPALPALSSSANVNTNGSGTASQTTTVTSTTTDSAKSGASAARTESVTSTTTDTAKSAITKVDTAATSGASSASTTTRPATRSATNDSEINATLIQAYNEICANRYGDAKAELALLPTWFGFDALSNFTQAALAGKQGRPFDAIDYMQRTVGAAPDFAWGYRTLGKLQQNRLKDLTKAEESYQAALAIQPDLSEVIDTLCDLRLAKNNFDGAIDAAESAIEATPQQSNSHYRLAKIYIQQWRLREALVEVSKAIDLDAEQARYYRTRATVKRYQGALNDAIADQQRAVELSKDKPFELVELASMNMAAGNVNRAADNLQEAVKLDPNNQEAHDKLVALLTQEKRYDDLISEMQRFVTLKPKDANAKLRLARALMAQGKNDKAIEVFKQVANLEPMNPEPHRELGALRLQQKDFVGAVREYTNALNINPSSVPDLVALGYAYAQNDDYTQAETAFVTALALQQLTQPNTLRTSPERLNLMRALAVLLMDEGRYSEAAAQFEAIHASSKGTEQEGLDAFRLTQAKALRDLNLSGAKASIDAYNALPTEQKSHQRVFLITTLLEAHRPDLVLPMIESLESSAAPDIKTQMIISRATALLQQGKPAEAAKLVANVVPNAAGTSDASEMSRQYVSLSRIAVANNDLTAADSLGTKAIEKYSKNYNAFIQVGRVCLKQGKVPDAVNFAKKALELNQYSTDAYLLLGDAQSKAGNVKEASASYRHAAELYPGLLEAHKALLETLRKLALKDEVKREEEQVAQMEKLQ